MRNKDWSDKFLSLNIGYMILAFHVSCAFIFPQISLYVLLSKFDGKSGKEYQTYKESILKKFQLTGLPPYLILYHKVSHTQPV